MRVSRAHQLWFAYVLHRLSGVTLAVFLPVHFWVLSYALTAPEKLNAFLSFAEQPVVKIMEFGLVFLLAVHAFGGLRLMAMEWLPWSAPQKTWAAAAVCGAFGVSGAFFLQVI
ncbi:MAG: succinate dehydrogenase, cytochrome b556 subunit [Pseudomonadota bacterium]